MGNRECLLAGLSQFKVNITTIQSQDAKPVRMPRLCILVWRVVGLHLVTKRRAMCNQIVTNPLLCLRRIR